MTSALVTEKEIRKFIDQDQAKEGLKSLLSYLIAFYQWVFIVLTLFALGFLAINAPAFYLKIRYALYEKTQTVTQKYGLSEEVFSPAFLVPEEDIQAATSAIMEKMPDNYLKIPEIGVNAPVIWQVEPSQTIEQLKNGVAHYQGTAMPGEEGGVFITGHSSDYWWNKGDYKQVFVLLDRLEPGDEIWVSFNGQVYLYKVQDKKVVKPSQLEVLQAEPGAKTLSLMTCVPVGTNLNRLVVKAELVPTATKAALEPLKVSLKSEIAVAAEQESQQQREAVLSRSICFLPPISPKTIKIVKSYVPDMRLTVRPLTYLPDP